MSRLIDRLQAWRRAAWSWITKYNRRRVKQEVSNSQVPEAIHAAIPEAGTVANLLAAGLTPPVDVALPSPGLRTIDSSPATAPIGPANRAERRARKSELRRQYERERRKFDKFVEPKGPKPTKQERAQTQTRDDGRQAPIATVVEDDGETLVVDIHHSDRQTKVLYELNEFFGQFNFRDTILDQLDRYWIYLDRMRRYEPEAWAFYKALGATLIPYAAAPDLWAAGSRENYEIKPLDPLSKSFLEMRPTFGCVAYGANPEGERKEQELTAKTKKKDGEIYIPKFIYFRKYLRPPPEVQPKRGGDVYIVTTWWDKPGNKHMKHGGRPTQFAVWVGRTGQYEALKTIKTKMVAIYSKRYGLDRIPQRLWSWSDHEDWAQTHGTAAIGNFLCRVFRDMVERIERTSLSMARVRIAKGDRHAVFMLDMHRLPYFFQDRDYELTEGGRRKRIFHMVKPHLRADGTAVGFSFRGAREFTWAGYDVRITIPGRDHLMLEEFNVGTEDEFWRRGSRKEWLDEGQIGEYLADLVEHGALGKMSTTEANELIKTRLKQRKAKKEG